ncbi:MAG: ASKHA domain-containing protein [Bacteroidota bacterium]
MSRREVYLGQDKADEDRSVLELLAEAGFDLPAACGGRGTCGQCLVRVDAGLLTPPTGLECERLSSDQLAEGWRLACQARVLGPVTVSWEDQHQVRPGKGFAEATRALGLAPAVVRREVDLPPAAAKAPTGDWERLTEALALDLRPDLWSCLGLSGLDHGRARLEVLLGSGALLGLATPGTLLGAVFDLGTTTVVGGLVDLERGSLMAVRAAFNAQRIYGADVLARLGHAQGGAEARLALRDRIQGQVRAMLRALLGDVRATPGNIVDLVIVGNTAMEHLFLGLDVGGLAALPFLPLHQAGLTVPASALGLPAHPGARVYFPPNLAGFVGADTVAGIVALDLGARPGPALMLDLGTNGELVLAYEGRLWACSTAAGPAFEGAEIGCGMAGLPGAIERVHFVDGDLAAGTIGGAAPRGICGSGLIDAVAVLREAGIMDPTGRLGGVDRLSPALAARLRAGARGSEVVLASGPARAVVLSQGDIRQVQLAKGAIAAGVRLLCRTAGISPGDLRQVYLAGAFGQHVEVAKAARIGLLPGIPPARVRAVGNVAGEGARLMLTHAPCRAEAEALVGRVEVRELAADPEFQAVFAEEMLFPD